MFNERKPYQSPGWMKNSSYYIAPVGDRTHDPQHTVASNMVKGSHALNHSATAGVCVLDGVVSFPPRTGDLTPLVSTHGSVITPRCMNPIPLHGLHVTRSARSTFPVTHCVIRVSRQRHPPGAYTIRFAPIHKGSCLLAKVHVPHTTI